MQYSVAAVLALAATTVSAWPGNGTVSYTTEVHTAYTTYCPAATTVALGGTTYTVTEATTLTITNCPCTIVKPVTTSSVVIPTKAPVYANHTTTAAGYPTSSKAGSVGTTSAKASASAAPSTITASGSNKVAALSGASLAGLLGLAAYIL